MLGAVPPNESPLDPSIVSRRRFARGARSRASAWLASLSLTLLGLASLGVVPAAFAGGPSADLQLTKTVNEVNPLPTDVVVYEITVTNEGPEDTDFVEVTDVLPAELLFDDAVTTQGSYDSGTGLWDVGSLGSGSDATLTLSVTIDVDVVRTSASEAVVNRATITNSSVVDTVSSNDVAQDGFLTQVSDLSITMIVDEDRPNEGDTVDFTIDVMNLGPFDATGVEILDVLPAGLTFVSAAATAGSSYDNGSGVWQIASLASAQPATLVLRAEVGAGTGGTALSNVASVQALDQLDPEGANNNAHVSVLPQLADLAVTKTVDDSAPGEGDTITYTVTVTNLGPDDATDLEVRDDLPAGLFFFDIVATVGVFDENTGVWTIPSLSSGGSATLTLPATLNSNTAGFSIPNTATVTRSDQADGNPSNDSETATIQVAAPGAVSIQVTTAPGNTNDFRPSWSPDGTHLAFDSNRNGNFDIWSVEVLSSAVQKLTTNSLTDNHPDWSPDGSTIAFVGAQVAQGNTNLSTIGQLGGPASVLNDDANSFDRFPAYSPDGSMIAFTKRPTGGNDDIWVIPASGGTPVQLTTDLGVDLHPTWSPDGTMIAFVSNRSGNNDIWVIPASGGTAVQITTDTDNDSAPDWSPDGSSFAFQSNRSGNNDIWIIPASGGPAVQITTDSGNDVQPDWSPAGNQIAFSRNGDLWVHTMADPTDLAVAMTVSNTKPLEGRTVKYKVTVSNQGSLAAEGVTVEDAIPSGLTLWSARPTEGAWSGSKGVWTIGTLDPGAAATLVLRAKVNRGTLGSTIVNTASLASVIGGDANPDNNVASVAIVVSSGSSGGGTTRSTDLPTVFAFAKAAPSPFRDRTTLSFDLPEPTSARLEVFDVSGRRVKILADGTLEAGRYAPVWDGRDEAGRLVAPGVYFVKLASEPFSATRRVVRLR